MTLTVDFCEARAREAGDEAEGASLKNVRERALRSQAAWQAMADRATDNAKARALKELEAQQLRDRDLRDDVHMERDSGPQ